MDRAEDFIRNTIDQICQVLRHDFGFAVRADQSDFIPAPGRWHLSYVHQRVIHRDSANYGTFLTAHDDERLIRKTHAVSVAIADRKRGDARSAGSFVGSAVADRAPFSHFLDK